MSDLSHLDPTSRFTGLADRYARCRPTYPPEVVDLILRQGGLGPDTLLVDVGCGTGISARLFAARGVHVVGIDPNEDMLRQAARAGGPACLSYRHGRGEETGLPDGSAQVVLCAQAFHWLDAPRALSEFHRILRTGGWVALVWNERDEEDPFTHACGEVIRTFPDTGKVEGPRQQGGKALLESALFAHGRKEEFRHAQEMDEEGLLGRVFSASYAPREGPLAEQAATQLRAVFARYQKEGRVPMRYLATVYLAQRQDSV
jgi:ubiquinone/menaquinone biosynthesis C-methylase UbiE